MNTKQYLSKIKHQGKTNTSPEALQELQKQHLLSIPFENWDIHDSIPINLNTDCLFDKIIDQQRGGICYELNALFYCLLKKLGFDAYLISGRVYFAKTDSYGAEFDHVAIIALVAEQRYLVDVGLVIFRGLRLKLSKM